MERPVHFSPRHYGAQGVHTTECFSSVFPKPQMSGFIDNWRFDYTDYSVKMIWFGCYHIWLNTSYKRIDSRLIHCGEFSLSVAS